MVKLKTVFSIIVMSVILFAHAKAEASSLQKRANSDMLPKSDNISGLTLTFFGTSTFLVEDERDQILIDGFFTRTKHKIFRKFSPSEKHIKRAVKHHHICPAIGRNANLDLFSSTCRKLPLKRLAYIIPTHGHYDHALDAPYLAALTGAQLISYQAVDAIYNASRKYQGFHETNLDWRKNYKPVFQDVDRKLEELPQVGDFKITLIKTPHGINPSSLFLARPKTKAFDFPATIWAMKEGVTFSVLIEHKGKSILIVPSAGTIGDTFIDAKIKASVVFAGIGGLGFKNPTKRKNYWHSVVTQTGARRVIPIHWDNDQRELPSEKNVNFKVDNLLGFGSTIEQFDELAADSKLSIDIVFAPPAIQFDPFHKLKE